MNRRQTTVLVLLAAAGAFVLGRATTPGLAQAESPAPAEAAQGGQGGVRTMVHFQFVPADGVRTKDLLIRGWDTGDIDYIDVSRMPRDEDPVRYLWTESTWRFVSQYLPRGR